MKPTFTIWNLIHLFGAAQGFFLAIVFLFHKRGNLLANRFLGLLLLIFSLRLLEIVAFWTKYLLVFPHFSLVGFPFSYLIGVVFYYYSRHLTTESRKLHKYLWLHTLPFLFVLIYTMPYYLLSREVKLRIIESTFYPETPSVAEIPFFRLIAIMLQFPHALLYIVLAIRHLNHYVHEQTNGKHSVRAVRLVWLHRLALGFGGFFGAWLLYNFAFIFGLPYNKNIDLFLTTAMTVFIYAIGYSAFHRPEIHTDIGSRTGPKYEKSTLTSGQAESFLGKLHELMANEKLYRNSDLKLSDLARKLGISSHHLSQIINEKRNQNFFDFINHYRVEEAKKIMSDPESRRYTLLSIAFDVGFNNKTSFNNFFKKHTGMNPSEFRAKMSTDQPSR